jgi:murein L,D-transpeptidase YafK
MKIVPSTWIRFGSYVLNYPNFLDRIDKKQGGGIWLHGHNEAQSPGEDLTNTKGCIVVSNSDLQEMRAYLTPRGNPIVVVNKLRFFPWQDQKELSRELTSLVNSWKQAWESLNTQKYLSFYSQDFMSGGMGYSAFKSTRKGSIAGRSGFA